MTYIMSSVNRVFAYVLGQRSVIRKIRPSTNHIETESRQVAPIGGCWFKTIEQRPAVARAYEIGASNNTTPTVTEESKEILLGQSQRAAAA